LQRKIGAGLTPDEFTRRAAGGRMGHVGLAESLSMVAAGLGWELEECEDTLERVLATTAVETPHTRVVPGQVAGIHQIARGRTAQGQSIELELAMYVGAPDPRDEVLIEGDPGARLLIPGGIFGDAATAAIVANAIPVVRSAAPGLRTMRDLPPMPPFQATGDRRQTGGPTDA
jgi:2,4-diaminopentanoate dehydrogenase